ncbi:MAG TPA: hypothetical protein VEL07_17575 [Planctomycetota bacterium]|nr:hypothetical protein [Planctomycetota bacterium]
MHLPATRLPTLAVMTALLLAVGARSDAATIADVTGTWSIDSEATWSEWQKRPEFADAPEDLKETIRETAMQMMGAMTVEVATDSFTHSDKGKVIGTTPFTVTGTEGDALIIEHAGSDGAKQVGRLELRGDRLAMSGGDNGVLVFRRGAAEAATTTPVE